MAAATIRRNAPPPQEAGMAPTAGCNASDGNGMHECERIQVLFHAVRQLTEVASMKRSLKKRQRFLPNLDDEMGGGGGEDDDDARAFMSPQQAYLTYMTPVPKLQDSIQQLIGVVYTLRVEADSYQRQMQQLEHAVRRARDENKALRERNEALEGKILEQENLLQPSPKVTKHGTVDGAASWDWDGLGALTSNDSCNKSARVSDESDPTESNTSFCSSIDLEDPDPADEDATESEHTFVRGSRTGLRLQEIPLEPRAWHDFVARRSFVVAGFNEKDLEVHGNGRLPRVGDRIVAINGEEIDDSWSMARLRRCLSNLTDHDDGDAGDGTYTLTVRSEILTPKQMQMLANSRACVL